MRVQSNRFAGQRKKRTSGGNGDIPPPHPCDIATSSVTIPKIPRTYLYRQIDQSQTTFSGTVGSVTAGAFAGQLSNLNNSAAFVALYDQYKILALRYTFIPRTNVVSGTAYNPPLYTIIDYDDTAVLGTVAAMTARDTCSVTQVYESVQRTFRPHIAVAAYSGTFTSYKNEPADWIDCASPNVQHYGLKTFIYSCATPAPVWDVEVEYFLEFRNVL